MLLPEPVGPVTARTTALLRGAPAGADAPLPERDVLRDRDVQLALWMLYETAFRGFDDVDADAEWDPDVLGLRGVLEQAFESDLRRGTGARVAAVAEEDSVAAQLLRMVAEDASPSVAAYLHRHASREQVVDYLRERSVQQLKESDPQSFLLPRLTGPAKTALAEVQYDEYGAGRPERLHQTLFATTLRAAGLDETYGAHVATLSALSLAVANLPVLLALHRRLVPAAAGHFAVFEASSSVPSRKLAAGIERVGLGAEAAAYFWEHVEADAVHEHVVAEGLCGSLVAEHPGRRAEVLFGAAACLYLDELSARELLARWGSEQVAS